MKLLKFKRASRRVIRRASLTIVTLLASGLLLSGCQPSTGVLVLTPEKIDLNWMPENDGHQNVVVTLCNRGGAPLSIKNVLPSCSCTVVKHELTVLKPGQSTQLSLDVHLAQHGDQEVQVTVETDSPETPSAVLRLRLSGDKRNIPQLWRSVPTTSISFRQPGTTVSSEVEVVVLVSIHILD